MEHSGGTVRANTTGSRRAFEKIIEECIMFCERWVRRRGGTRKVRKKKRKTIK